MTTGPLQISTKKGIDSKNIHRNFEVVYSDLYENSSPFLEELETVVYDYFSSLRLPEHPTLYDHLLLSLRPKDVVATFNWDPFLFDAWNRNKNIVQLPKIVHLHGNVRVARCEEHPAWGEHGMICPICEDFLKPTRLLYPVTKKNYTDDMFIKTEWSELSKWISEAMTLTIFGYGAPDTDIEAVDLLGKAWNKDERFIERVEVIDIRSKNELWRKWDPFIIRQYLDHGQDFYKSRIPLYPRRTCEALYAATRYGLFVEPNPLPRDADFDDLYSWFEPLISAEERLK